MAIPSLPEIGRHFIVGLSGYELLPEEREALSSLQPTGIILFAQNISDSPDWPSRLIDLIEQVRSITGQRKLIVSIDHEGGKVFRLPPPATRFPAAASWAGRTEKVALSMGRELRALGINLSFAPVADIHSEPANPVIGVRAFGQTPQMVADQAQLFLAALSSTGVAGCAKHFPGHGDTRRDSHLELPVVEADRNLLERRELIPFKRLIAADVRLIMTAHVKYTALDSDYPATLSGKILRGLLREELGYKQAIISDALEMKALSGSSPESICLSALHASVDFLLLGQIDGTPPSVLAKEIALTIGRHLETDPTLREALNASTARVRAFQEYVAQLESHAPPGAVADLGCAAHQQLCQELLAI